MSLQEKKKRILFIVPSLVRAGAETQVVDLINGLPDSSIKKYLFTFEENIDQLNRINQKKIKFYNKQRKFKYDLSLAKFVSDIIDDEDIDIVHCSLQISLLMGWLGCKYSTKNPKLIAALHTTVNRTIKDDILDLLLYQWLLRACDKIIFVCKTQRQHWIKKYPFINDRSCVIYNGVDPDYFSPGKFTTEAGQLLKKFGIGNEQLVFCCIAGFRPEKGHAYLLSAFKAFIMRKSTAILLLAGDGVELDNIQQLTKSLELENNVFFLGQVNDVRPLLEASDVAIIASTAVETFSIAMLEAMSMEVPLVATDIGGTKEAVLHKKNGFIIKPGDVLELSESLFNISINNDEINEMGKEARNCVIKYFYKKRMIIETSKILSAK